MIGRLGMARACVFDWPTDLIHSVYLIRKDMGVLSTRKGWEPMTSAVNLKADRIRQLLAQPNPVRDLTIVSSEGKIISHADPVLFSRDLSADPRIGGLLPHASATDAAATRSSAGTLANDTTREANFPLSIFNSFKLTAIIVVIQLVTATTGAYAFSKLVWKGRNVLFLLYVSSGMIPLIYLSPPPG